MTAGLFAAIDATWPAAARHRTGAFVVREGQGGGKRVSAASAEGDWGGADIDAAIARHHALQQAPLFMIRPGEDRLDAALAARGLALVDPVVVLAAPLAALAEARPPPITAFCLWPPLSIMADIWAAGDIGPDRMAVMARAAPPRAAVLGRVEDRAAGAGFIAVHAGIAMLHAFYILPHLRRRGLARRMLHEAAHWASGQGAQTLALQVTRANLGAIALYQGAGLAEVAGYHYRLAAGAVA